ncbi:MAG: sigma-70 family RNA polymerase sigma factor [Planctomycetaceae bacterium]|nr:sigma-70 family RNA polymerase sigma factor [Planctomycetaceae bacterium]
MSSVASSNTGSTSHTLLGRVRKREASAWQRFAEIYTPLVYAWARRGGLQASDAADIVQEVFHRVADRIDQFGCDREGGSFRGWLRAIARNEVRLLYRRRGQRAEFAGAEIDPQDLAEIPDWDRDDSEESATADRHYVLHRTLRVIRADFEEPTWQSFWRTVVDGEPPAVVAGEVGLSAGAVRQAKLRVLCRLRQELQGF